MQRQYIEPSSSQTNGGASPRRPLWSALIVPFVVEVALIASLVGLLSFQNGQRAVNTVANQLRSETTARIHEHLSTFLQTPHQINRLNAMMIRAGMPPHDDAPALEHHVWQQIQVFDAVTSIYFGNPQGGLVNAGREGKAGENYVITTQNFERGPFEKYRTDAEGRRTELLTVLPDFDARTRPWYQRAVAETSATWSDIYILFTGQDMAIAASRPVYDAAGNLLGVASSDIFLAHLSDFLRELDIGRTAQSFVVERSGLLVASSYDESPFEANEGEPPRRRHATESASPTIARAAEFLHTTFGDYHAINQERQLEFLIEGERQFLEVSPIRDPYGIDWLIVVVIPEADFMDRIWAINRTTGILITVASFLTIGLGIVMVQRISRPIRHLTASAQALALGEWDHPPGSSDIKELDVLSASFSHMAGQLQTAMQELKTEVAVRKDTENSLRKSHQQLTEALRELEDAQARALQQERLAAVGQLSAGIAHDFNNILGGIVLYTQLLLRMPDLPEGARERLGIIYSQSERAADLVQQILDFGRQSMMERHPLALDSFLKEMTKLLQRTLPESITVTLDLEPGAYSINADPTRVQQAVLNLALNARDAMPEGGRLTITLDALDDTVVHCAACGERERGDWVRITIHDTGSGIPPDVLPHIFEPFFTTRAPLGHGLGLAQVFGIVKQHEGHIDVATTAGEGTTFALYWPRLPDDPTVQETPAGTATPTAGNHDTILVVEDDATMRAGLVEALTMLGYRVVEAASGQAALELWERRGSEIKLVLSDWVMPAMGGLALAQGLHRRNSGVKVLLLTGHVLDDHTKAEVPPNVVGWIVKPVDMDALATLIGSALET